MNTQNVIDEVRLKLGAIDGMETEIELNDNDLSRIVASSLRELTTFMDTPAYKTVPYQEQIDISKLKIASVLHVMRAQAPYGTTEGVSFDPFYLSGAVGVSGPNTPDSHGILQTQILYAVRAQAQNTIQDDLTHLTNLYDKKLYVSYSGIRPSYITIIYKPIVESVEDLPSDYWVTYLIRLATAHGKVIIGTVRSKYTVAGSPMTLNADIKDEGIEELKAVREELRKLRHLTFD